MRQVPHFLIIGDGRIARHFQHYFSLLQLPFDCWHRKQPLETLQQLATTATHILILISDRAIDAFAKTLRTNNAMRIHFSGSVISDHAYGAHPLMTFANTFYTLEDYQKIAFVIDDDAPSFEELLPGLTNPHVRLSKSLKAKYHALCVLSGNFSYLLWKKFYHAVEHELKLPTTIIQPYLMQQMKNIIDDPTSALTGPLARGDHETIAANLAALTGDPFQKIYESFVSCFQHMQKEVPHEHS